MWLWGSYMNVHGRDWEHWERKYQIFHSRCYYEVLMLSVIHRILITSCTGNNQVKFESICVHLESLTSAWERPEMSTTGNMWRFYVANDWCFIIVQRETKKATNKSKSNVIYCKNYLWNRHDSIHPLSSMFLLNDWLMYTVNYFYVCFAFLPYWLFH